MLGLSTATVTFAGLLLGATAAVSVTELVPLFVMVMALVTGTAPDFFDCLLRLDTHDGSAYFRHDKPVTVFPDELLITLYLRDSPCSSDLKDTAVRPPLTPEIISALRLHFYWKDGIALRPVEGSKRTAASVTRLLPFAKLAADELAPRFQWNYTFTIESAGVPLTNDLVFIIESEDHKIAARTHARL